MWSDDLSPKLCKANDEFARISGEVIRTILDVIQWGDNESIVTSEVSDCESSKIIRFNHDDLVFQ